MPSWRIVVQSRISSARLPAKALLPINGIPSAALCVLRAGNRGADIVLATSCSSDDDVLVQALSTYAITIVRGSLNNVLDRFVRATEDLQEEDIVVRLTADNLVPDGDFVEKLVQQFMSMNVDYLGTNSPFDGLPYGLSAEIFSVRVLRSAASNAKTDAELEHVTTWIRKNRTCSYVESTQFGLVQRYDHLRSTVDTLDDYIRMVQLFEGLNVDPVRVGWKQLIEKLSVSSNVPKYRVPYSMDADGRAMSILSLGTAQLGMSYGRTNVRGQPSATDSQRIIRFAIDHGITEIDTARAYGVSESRVGKALGSDLRGRARVTTKLDPLSFLASDVSSSNVERAIDASVFQSCRELRVDCLDVLMLHRWAHREQFGGAIWSRLLGLVADGVIQKLGASVSNPDEAIAALRECTVKHIQLPCNILDWRWYKSEFLAAVAARPDVTIHVRSAFLQGILLASAEHWPHKKEDAVDCVAQLDKLVHELGRESRADLCFAYLAGLDWLSSIVIGVETEQQLEQNLLLANRPPLTNEERFYIRKIIKKVPEYLLNPALWDA